MLMVVVLSPRWVGLCPIFWAPLAQIPQIDCFRYARIGVLQLSSCLTRQATPTLPKNTYSMTGDPTLSGRKNVDSSKNSNLNVRYIEILSPLCQLCFYALR